MRCCYIIGLLLLSTLAKSQNVTFIKHQSEADIIVRKVDSISEADLVVYYDYAMYFTRENKGIWIVMEYPIGKYIKIYFTDNDGLAMLKIYETKFRSEAGWIHPEKKCVITRN